MDGRRQRVVWLVALGLVTALASAPSVLTALGSAVTRTEIAAENTSATVPLSGGIASLLRTAPDALRTFLSDVGGPR